MCVCGGGGEGRFYRYLYKLKDEHFRTSNIHKVLTVARFRFAASVFTCNTIIEYSTFKLDILWR